MPLGSCLQGRAMRLIWRRPGAVGGISRPCSKSWKSAGPLNCSRWAAFCICLHHADTWQYLRQPIRHIWTTHEDQRVLSLVTAFLLIDIGLHLPPPFASVFYVKNPTWPCYQHQQTLLCTVDRLEMSWCMCSQPVHMVTAAVTLYTALEPHQALCCPKFCHVG